MTYSFDEASLSLLGTSTKIQDFKNRVDTAAQDWGAKTGRTITQAPTGTTSNITVRVSDTNQARDDDGAVFIDNTNPSRRVMQFSDEFSAWSNEGKDRIASHEFGHIMGLNDVKPADCPGITTVMRQTGPGSTTAEL